MNKTIPKVGLVSLGCPKALVDSERILTRLRSEGYALSTDYEQADVVLVNTCGFLDSAKQESLEAIGDAIEHNGSVIVTGCMGADEQAIRDVHPKVLSVSGPHQYETVMEAVHNAAPPAHDPYVDLVPPEGIKLTPRHYAYLKISEGCNQSCSFCIIPSLRGKLVSRPVNAVLKEAERLVDAGVQEILVISQDTAAYGSDLRYATSPWHDREVAARLYDMCDALGDLEAWIRLHYVYPYPHVDDIIPLMNDGKILPYLDIPFQHASPAVLKNMRRPGDQAKTLDRIHKWRKDCPDITIRSTFIVGFPGETDDDFQFLLDWMKDAQLDRVGCFKYEAVDGAPANSLPGAVPEELKQERWDAFMQTQRDISAKKLQQKIGQTIAVIIDEVDAEGAIGRSSADAPEIDGNVYLQGHTDLSPGDVLAVEVDNADEYDLWGHAVNLEDGPA